MKQAVISGDSLLYVHNELYEWHNQQPTDFYKYKATRQEGYEKAASANRKKIRQSDRYYLGYLNKLCKRRIIILFDPKKIKYRLLGDIQDVDYCEPLVVDLESKKISFGFFPFPDPE